MTKRMIVRTICMGAISGGCLALLGLPWWLIGIGCLMMGYVWAIYCQRSGWR